MLDSQGFGPTIRFGNYEVLIEFTGIKVRMIRYVIGDTNIFHAEYNISFYCVDFLGLLPGVRSGQRSLIQLRRVFLE